MNKTTEALKLAEEALVEYRDNQHIKAPRKTLAAIREALADHSGDANEMVAEPVNQEPVAWKFYLDGCNQVVLDEDADFVIRHNGTPLYAAPVQPVNQEPVAWKEFNEWMHREIPSGTIIGDSGWWASKIFKRFIKSTALVDAKAIRAEALEEAAKWFEANGANMMTKDECAAGIRGLK